MINLLPEETKKEIRAARTNVILLRYNILALSLICLIAVTCAGFYFMLSTAQASAVSEKNNNANKAQNYATVRTNVDQYKANLSIANQILNTSINYSSFLFKLTELLPTGAIIEDIKLDANSFNQQTTFTARTTSFAKATELKERFQKSSLFSNVYFQTLVDDSSTTSAPKKHPIMVTISAKINKDIQR